MSFLDLLGEFDAALEWPVDDPLLQDPSPGTSTVPSTGCTPPDTSQES